MAERSTVPATEAVSNRIRALFQEHGDFIMLLVLFAAFRVMAVLFFRPGGYIRDWSDFTVYMGTAGLSDEGHYPSIHYWLEYPPLFPWLYTGLYRLSLLIPPWMEDPRLWFYALLSLVLTLFEIGNFVLVYATALLVRDQGKAFRTAAFYAALFVPIFVLTTLFDAIPLFFMLLGLYLMLKDRAGTSGIALGIGFVLKITPIILLPVAVRKLTTLPQRVRHVLGAVLCILVLSLPFLYLDSHLYLMPFRSALGRSSWETLWAVAEGYFSFGTVGGSRFDRTVADFSTHPQTLPWLLISLAFGLIYLWFYTRPVDYRDRSKVLGLATFTVALFMLYSKGYSPQFLVYLLPFILLCCLSWRGIAYAVGLSLLNFLEQPVYFVLFPDQRAFFVGILVFRTLLISGVAIEGLLTMLSQPGQTHKTWSRALAIGMAALLVWTIWSGVTLSQAYYDARYQSEPYRVSMTYLKEEAQAGNGTGVLLTDSATYRRVYPFLHQALDLRVAATGRPAWQDDLRDWTTARQSFWLWRGERTDPDLEAWLDQNARLVKSQPFDWGTLFLLAMKEKPENPSK